MNAITSLPARSCPAHPALRFLLLATVAATFWGWAAPAAIPQHQSITNYQNAASCTVCHTNAAHQVMATTHWTWLHEDHRTGKPIGKRNVINNYCVALPSNEPRCTSCHVGVGYRDQSFDFSDMTKVDCLVCHDKTGTYKKFPTAAGAPWTGPTNNVFNGVVYPPVDLNFVAQNVGKSSRATCGACHFLGGGGDAVKHGDLDTSLKNPDRNLDVHMGLDGKNFQCADCHKTRNHEIPGSYYSKDHADSQSCESCHTAAPHKSGQHASRLNAHTSRVGCQTCHIPEFARGRTTTTSWDWSTAGIKGTNGQNQIIRDANGDPIYDTQKGTFSWAKNVRPEYVWFNGEVDYLTVDDVIDPSRRVTINKLHGSVADAKSRILPVKRFTGKQPYDAGNNVLAVPHLFGTDTNAYWRTFNWTNAIAAGMAYVGKPFSGQIGWVETEMFWIENHMVAPKEKSVGCAECHTAQAGRLNFEALGYEPARTARLQDLAVLTGADHTGRFAGSYKDATSCTVCHADAAKQVMHTTHWTWEHKEPGSGKVIGKRNVINNYCVALPSNEPRCTSCHVGVGYKDKTFDFSDASKVDCLVCHDTTGTYKKFPTMAGAPWTGPGTNVFGGVAYPPVNLDLVAEKVGKSSRATCGACHFLGGGGDAVKHGDLDTSLKKPDRSLDVHMGVNGKNFQCADCHKTQNHDIPGSYYTKDHADSQSCESCHTTAPHKNGEQAARLNAHTSRVGCQSCHIPAYARGRTTMTSWDWSTAGIKGTNGQNQIIRDANGDPIYDTQKGTFTWAKNVRPQYVWFNGQVDYLTVEDVIDPRQRVKINTLHGSIADPKSRILPVKRFTGKQPFDPVNNVLAVPHLFGTDNDAYWKTFNWTNAITAGMAYVGKPFSGQIGWVETEMFWIENHMVAPKEKSVGCAECHTAEGGRLDFAALGYEPERAERLKNLAVLTGPNHAGRFGTNYIGSASCTQCHPGAVDQVMASVHYLWRTPNPKVAFPGGGSHGMIDRFCGLVGSSAMVNYYADLGAHKGSSACGKCHVGDGLPFPNPATGQFTTEQKEGIDCLICHASKGNYDMTGDGVYDEHDAEATHRALVSDPNTGRRSWHQDRSLRAAESVTSRVDTAACLRCHEHGQAAPDYKRGTPYSPEHDTHAAWGLRCTDCHEVQQHKIARGSRVSDMHAWELQHVEVNCVKCHTSRPHPEWPENPAFKPYNEHANFIACETCHIPRVSGAARRIWYSTFGTTNGPEFQIPQLDPETGVYEPYSVYGADYAARPAYRWFNGDVSMLAEPMHDANAWDFRIASKATPNAKIYPFRPIVNGMVMDRRGFGYDPNFNPQFTMAAAMDAMAGPMKMMGFMRPEGLNERERAVLSQFPNLLGFDVETYVETGNVKESVNVGLGRLGMLMSGQDAWGMSDNQLSAIGATFWSGDLIGLDLPNNPADPTFVPNGDPTQPTGSFVSLNHAVKRQGLRCNDCHSSNSVLDYPALGYTPAQATHLKTMLTKVQFLSSKPTAQGLLLKWSAIPGRSYQVVATTNLRGGPWQPVTGVIYGVSQWYEYTVPTATLSGSGQMFFKVIEIPR
jgi:octaheme c-type cytochrome (tetrathionate reductase family)